MGFAIRSQKTHFGPVLIHLTAFPLDVDMTGHMVIDSAAI
jgi:hypothetical protein